MTFYVWKESQEEFKFFLESEFIRESCHSDKGLRLEMSAF